MNVYKKKKNSFIFSYIKINQKTFLLKLIESKLGTKTDKFMSDPTLDSKGLTSQLILLVSISSLLVSKIKLPVLSLRNSSKLFGEGSNKRFSHESIEDFVFLICDCCDFG